MNDLRAHNLAFLDDLLHRSDARAVEVAMHLIGYLSFFSSSCISGKLTVHSQTGDAHIPSGDIGARRRSCHAPDLSHQAFIKSFCESQFPHKSVTFPF